MSERQVPPGGEAKVDVKVNTRGRRGTLAKSVTIFSNDPKEPRAVLKVRASINAPPPEAVATPGPGPAVRKRPKLLEMAPTKLQQRPPRDSRASK